jgi:uncharacterized membrane protein YkoI
MTTNEAQNDPTYHLTYGGEPVENNSEHETHEDAVAAFAASAQMDALDVVEVDAADGAYLYESQADADADADDGAYAARVVLS